MAQEDQTQKCSNSGGSGAAVGGGTIFRTSNKRPKQKKVPQRGLGVAQLEKIRLEEQQKKDAASASASASILPSPSPPPTKPPFRSLSSNPNFYPPPNLSSASPRTDFSSLNSVNSMFLENNDNIPNTNTVSLTNPAPWWSSIAGHENVRKLWSCCEFNREKENPGIDPGLGFQSNLELPYELNPIWPLPGLMQRVQQYQATPSMVNVSSASSSSSVLNYQMEPPSNQNFHGNYTPIWPEEEKMVGMKRPYPFSLDNPSGPLFNYKFPPIVQNPITSRSDESSVSCVNGGAFNFEPPCNTTFRDGPSCSTSISGKSIKENGISDGDFLTLAPPTAAKTAGLKLKDLSTNQVFCNNGLPNFDSLPYQGNMADSLLVPGGLNQQQQPYYSFLPPSMAHVGQPKATVNNCNGGEVGENVDLNLKL